MKIINVGFMTESWNVKNQVIKEDNQSEMELGDDRKTPESDPESDPLNDTELINKIKAMIDEYKKTKDSSLLRPIVKEMSKIYAPEAKEIVDKFENDSLKTTRGNYGKYMQLLSDFKGVHKAAMIMALRDAGAGRGLDDALRII